MIRELNDAKMNVHHQKWSYQVHRCMFYYEKSVSLTCDPIILRFHKNSCYDSTCAFIQKLCLLL
jgi:hypothetical protein